jgi:hypothetical protein
MMLVGYVLGMSGLFIACVMVKGFFLTLAVYGSLHVGCALLLLLLCHRATHAPRQRVTAASRSHPPVRLGTTDPEQEWVIIVHLN